MGCHLGHKHLAAGINSLKRARTHMWIYGFSTSPASCVCPKWHPIPYVVNYFWPGTMGNRVPFGGDTLWAFTIQSVRVTEQSSNAGPGFQTKHSHYSRSAPEYMFTITSLLLLSVGAPALCSLDTSLLSRRHNRSDNRLQEDIIKSALSWAHTCVGRQWWICVPSFLCVFHIDQVG